MAPIISRCPVWLALMLVGLALGACTTSSPSRYVAPRVTGRVINSETKQPLADVQVRRLSNDSPKAGEDVHGGRLLENDPVTRTSDDGMFVLPSVRSFGFLGTYGWYSIDVVYRRNGYQSLVCSYTLMNATNTASGEPIVVTGDVLLVPMRD